MPPPPIAARLALQEDSMSRASRPFRTLALGLLLAASVLAALAAQASAHPLALVPPTDYVCHYAVEAGAGGRVNGPPAPAAIDDGCPYGHSPAYANKLVGFHDNDFAAHLVVVYEVPAALAALPLYPACLLRAPRGPP